MQSFENQIMYKLAAIETQVKNISENLTAAIHRVEDKILETSRDNERKFAKMETRVEQNEDRIDAFEAWKNAVVAKVTMIGAAIGGIWALFGARIESKIGSLFG